MKNMVPPYPEDTRTPFQRFEDLAKQVLTVPKEVIDKRQAEYEKKRKRRKKRRSR
jgi:hypothetical protein